MRLGKRFISILVSIAMVWNNVGTPIAEGYQNLAAQDEQSLAAEGAGATPQDDSVVSQEESVPAVQEDPAQQNAGTEASVEGDASGGEEAQASAQEQEPTDAQATPDSAATSENMSTAEGSAQASGDNAATADPSSVSGQGAVAGGDGTTPAATGQGAAGDTTSSAATADGTSSDSASDDAANGAGAATNTATPDGAESVAPATPAPERMLESTLGLAEGGTYRVTVTYGEGAGVPDGASLVLREYSQTPEHYGEPGYEEQFKDRPLPTETFLSGDDLAARLDLVAKGLSVGEGLDNVYLAKLLQVDLVDAQGQPITLNAPLKVLIETNAIDIADAPAVEMGYFDPAYDAATMPPEAAVKPISVENKTENKSREDFDRDPEHPLRTRLEMSTDHLGTLAVVCVARAKAIWEQEGERVVLQAAGALETTAEEWGDPGELGEGIDSLGAWWVRFAAEPAYGARAWLATSAIEGAEPRSEGTGYAAWRLSDPAGQLFDATGTASPVELEPGDVFALGWDTGAVGEGEQSAPKGEEQLSAPEDAIATPEDGSTSASDPTSADGATEPGSQPAPGTTNSDGTPTTPSDETSPESQPAADADAAPSSSTLPAIPEPKQLEEFVSYESKFVASDGQTYRITAGFDAPGAVPAGALLSVREIVAGTREYLDYVSASARELGVDQTDVSFARVFDISFVDPTTGREYEPSSPVTVRIELTADQLAPRKEASVVHFGDKPEVVDATQEAGAVAFETESFSVYVVLQTVLRQTLIASDGSSYEVSVSYDETAGIPADAQLRVSEIREGDAGYDEYVARTADALGRAPEHLAFARAFDIALVNPATGEEYQPTSSVKVGIRFLSNGPTADNSASVMHFANDPSDAITPPEELPCTLAGQELSFETGGFSIYVVTQDKLLRYYVFLNDADGRMSITDQFDAEGKALDNRNSYIFAEQALVDGESVVEPPYPTRPGAVFSKWTDANGNVLSFPQPVSINDDDIPGTTHKEKQDWLDRDENKVYYYASYGNDKTTIIYYNQSGLVVEKREVEKPQAGQPAKTENTRTVSYLPIQDKEGSVYTFKYWTDDPRGEGNEVNGNGVIQITADSPTQIEVYPALDEGHNLHFETNKGAYGLDSADYIAPLTVVSTATSAEANANRVLAALNARANHGIPTAPGYIFEGWYISSSKSQFESGSLTPVFKPNAARTALELGRNASGIEYKRLTNIEGDLPNNPTLYAHWVPVDSADYMVVFWRQKITDDKNASDDEKTYDYAETKTGRTARPGTVVSPSAADMSKAGLGDYRGFHYNADNTETDVVVRPDGKTVVNVYYDRDLIELTFVTREFRHVNNPDRNKYYYDIDNDLIVRNNNDGKWYNLYYNDGTRTYYVHNRTVIYTRTNNTYIVASNYNSSTQYYAKLHNEGDTVNFRWVNLNRVASPYNNGCYEPVDTSTVYSGLYGQPLSQYNYSWPDGYWMNPENDSLRWTYVQTAVAEFKESFTTVTFGSNSATVQGQFYFQNTDGSENTNYDRQPDASASYSKGLYTYSTAYNNLFTGMHPVKYRIGNGGWKYDTNVSNQIILTDNIKVYYERNQETLTFFDPMHNRTVATRTLLFGAPLAAYADVKPSTTYDDLEFTGWYVDEDCTIPFVFAEESMPAANKRIYAGWMLVKNRAQLIPNGGDMLGQGVLMHLDPGEKIGTADPTRDYISVESEGHYVYDEITGTYTETEDKTGGYDAKAGAYTFQGWYEAELDLGPNDVKQAVEYDPEDKPGRYAYAYGHYEEQDGERVFVYAQPKKDADGEYVLKTKSGRLEQYDLEVAPTEPITLVALWQRAGGFRVVYDVVDPALAGTLSTADYKGISAPEDPEEYLDGSHATVLAPITAPKGYKLECWVDKHGRTYKPNELVPVEDDNSHLSSDGNENIVTLKARYAPYNPSDRTMAEYTFMTNVKQVGSSVEYVEDYYEWEKQRIAVNERLEAPLTPATPDGYAFKGWYYDMAGTRPFNGFGVITNPMYTTLYAVFERVFHVNYYLTDSSTREPTSTVIATQTYKNPGAGSSENAYERLDSRHITHSVDLDHYVVAWVDREHWSDYQSNPNNDSYQYAYNSLSKNRVTRDMNLCAVLKERQYVTFDSTGGSFVGQVEVSEGSWPSRPKEPTREGFEFLGWFTTKTGETTATGAEGEEYFFDKKLSELPTYNGSTLYARWRGDGITRTGTLHVIFWAQTADRPEDPDEAAADTSHYQMIHRIDINDVYYGEHSLSEIKTTDEMASFLEGGELDIVKTIKNARAAGSVEANAFVSDALGYKGNNADVIQNYKAEDYIDDLSNYFEFSEKSDSRVEIGENDGVINVRFDLKTFYLEFSPKFNNSAGAEIHYLGSSYPYNGSARYVIPVWLNKPISTLWPIDKSSEINPSDDHAYLIWLDVPANIFYCWEFDTKEYTYSDGEIGSRKSEKKQYRSTLNLADKQVVDSIIEYGSQNVLTVTPNRYLGSALPITAVVHYLIRDSKFDRFTELTDLRTTVRVAEKTVVVSEDEDIRVRSDSNGYSGVVKSKCLIHAPSSAEFFHKGIKYAYNTSSLEPASISGYTVIDNETAHDGYLINADGTQGEGHPDTNYSDMYNLIFNRMGKAQAICDETDPTYLSYFKYHMDQYVEAENTYNFYFYYKPLTYELSLYTDASNQFGPAHAVSYGDSIDEMLASIAAPIAPNDYVSFAGWATAPYQTSSDARFDGKGNTMPSQNLTLYAIWKPNIYTVTTLGVDEDGNGFLADANGNEIDRDGNPVENGKVSATYTAAHGQQLRELMIKNPKMSKRLFRGWLDAEANTSVTNVYTIKRNLKIKPQWTNLDTRQVEYLNNYPKSDYDYVSFSEMGEVEPTVPLVTDGNVYVLGAKVKIMGSNGLYIYRRDVDGHTYRADFAYWEDVEGNRYYPNTTYVFREGSPETLTLKAIYSRYRETTLLYDKNADDAMFVLRGADGKPIKKVEGGTPVVDSAGHPEYEPYDNKIIKEQSDPNYGRIRVLYRDWHNREWEQSFKKRPNDLFPVGEDEDFERYAEENIDPNPALFTVTRTDEVGNDIVFAGWGIDQDSSVVLAQNGDYAYVNTIRDSDGVLRNTFYAVWGICKVVDRDGKEHIFDTIQKAVDFINTSGLINNRTGTIEMLIDYKLGEGKDVTIPAGCTVTLTTAKPLSEKSPNDGVTYYYKDDSHAAEAGNAKHAIITRGVGGESILFTSGSLTLTNIIFDGNGTTYASPDKGETNTLQTKAMITAKDGGALTLDSGAVLQNSKLGIGNYRGAAIFIQDSATVTMNDGSAIKDCSAREGCAVNLADDDKSSRTFTMNDGAEITNCIGNYWGGAIRINKGGTVNLVGGEITDCKTGIGISSQDGGRGGAVCNNGGKLNIGEGFEIRGCSAHLGGAVYAGGTTSITGGTITRCYATKTGGAVHMNGNTDISGGTISYCYAATSGGAIHRGGGNLNITGTAQISKCVAPKGGGIYTAWLLIATTGTDPVISECEAKGVAIAADGTITVASNYTNENMGGAIYASGGITINSGTITSNAAYYGGAVYSVGGMNYNGGTISHSTANAGGGVYLSAGGSTFKTNALITQCEAEIGAGVFVANGSADKRTTITLEGATITDNDAAIKGGGIAFGGDYTKAVFKNIVSVQENYMGAGTDRVECNVYLDRDSNTIIESQGLSYAVDKHIGVYVPDDGIDGKTTTLFDEHGVSGAPFGVFTSSNYKNLSCFTNDRNPVLYGVNNPYDSADKQIYWVDFICKITDVNGNLLYRDSAKTKPAVYGKLDSNLIASSEVAGGDADSAFGKLTMSDPSLFGDGDSVTADLYDPNGKYISNEYYVKMLVDEYTTSRWILAPADRKITLTTATQDAAAEDGFPYEADARTTYSVIKRGEGTTGSAMITAKGDLILEGITLDGGAVLENGAFTGLDCKQGGSIVCVQESAKLWVKDGATLQNSFNGVGESSGTRGGGAISNREKGTNSNEIYIETGAVIQNCGTNGFGGAIALKQGKLVMSGGTIRNCYAFVHSAESKSGVGGAIHIYSADGNNPSTLTLRGGTISNCHAAVNGAGIMIESNQTRLYLSGSPSFNGNTVTKADYAEKKNGGEKAYANNQVRQDIFIPAYTDAAPFIQVTERLTSNAGSIWVWADTAGETSARRQHHKETQQFAVLAGDAAALAASGSEEIGLTAFHNAQDDKTTDNTTSSYLTGVMKDDDAVNVYWGSAITGTRKVILKKLDDERKPLAGAKFRIYGASWNELKEDEVYTSGETGVYNIDVYNFGTYYLVETVFPEGYEPTPGYTGFVEDDPATWWYYKLTVGEPGDLVDGDPTKVISPRGTYIEGPFQRNASTPTVPSTTPSGNDPGPTEPDEPASPTVAVPKVGDGTEDGHGSGYLAWKELSSVLWGGVVNIEWVTRFDKDNNEFLALRYYSDRIAVIYYGGKYYKAVDASGADAYGLLSTETGPSAWWTSFSLSMLGAEGTHKDSSGHDIRWIEIDGPSAISDDSTGPGTRDLEADNTKWNYRADMWLGDIFQSNRTAFEWEPFRDNTMVLTRHDGSGEDEAGIVWYEGEYYKPLGSDGSHQIVRLLGSGFTVADLTDGAAHSYERNGGASVIWFKIPNPYNQVEVDPNDNPPAIGSWLTGDDRYLFRFTAVDPAQYQWYQYRDGVIVAAHNNSNEWKRNPAVIWYDGKYYRPADDDGGAKQANLELGNLNEGFNPSDLSDGQAHTYGMANQSVTITWEEIDVEALRPKENVVGTYTLTEVESWDNAKRFNITVTNSTQAYSKSVTVQIPVTGTVTNVVGASWTQDNGMLSLTFNKWGNGFNAGESYIQNDVAIYGNNLTIS